MSDRFEELERAFKDMPTGKADGSPRLGLPSPMWLIAFVILATIIGWFGYQRGYQTGKVDGQGSLVSSQGGAEKIFPPPAEPDRLVYQEVDGIERPERAARLSDAPEKPLRTQDVPGTAPNLSQKSTPVETATNPAAGKAVPLEDLLADLERSDSFNQDFAEPQGQSQGQGGEDTVSVADGTRDGGLKPEALVPPDIVNFDDSTRGQIRRLQTEARKSLETKAQKNADAAKPTEKSNPNASKEAQKELQEQRIRQQAEQARQAELRDLLRSAIPLTGPTRSQETLPQSRQTVIVKPQAEAARSTASATPQTNRRGPYVQLGSLDTEADAERAYAQALRQAGDLVEGREWVIQPVSIPGRGRFFRLRLVGFANLAEASRFCSSLKSRGLDCFVTQ